MPNDSTRPDVAVFIDFENVYVSVRDKLDANPNFESIMDRCEDFGRVVIARAYADWYRYPRVTSALYANGIEPMYVPTYYYDREMGRTGRAIKNSVDMNLCVDAMKTLFTNPNIAKFVLATGDRDFIPLVNTIRQQGKEVIVIGIGGAASAHLAQSADEFIFYESLLGKSPSAELLPDQPRSKMPEKGRDYEQPEQPAPVAVPPPAREPEPSAEPDVYDILVKAIHLARERGYVCSFGSLKLLMKELMGGDFKEGRYKDGNGKPLAKFKDFVMEAERRGKVQVFTNGTVNEVFLPGEDPYKLSQFAQDLKEEATSEAAPQEPRQELRAAPSNRRRRRRPRGQRGVPGSPPEHGEVFVGDEEELPELAGVDDLTLESFEQPSVADLDALETYTEHDVVPADAGETGADRLFENLLERVEQEDADLAVLDALDPLVAPSMPEPAASATQVPAPVQEQAAVQQAPRGERPFAEEEWSILRDVVGRFDRPASFVQIHDALRESRNRVGATLNRTNEELRTLIKQAINNGVLTRIGKGSRIAYQLTPVGDETVPEIEAVAPADEADQMTLVEQADQAEPVAIEPLVDTVVEPPAAAKPARRRRKQPAAEAVVAEPAAAPEPLAAPVEQPEQTKPARRRRKATPAVEAASTNGGTANGISSSAPEAEAPPAETPRRRSRSRKKTESVADGQSQD